MSDQKQVDKPAYAAPKLTVVGSLHGLTMEGKTWGGSDGFALLGLSIPNVSP